MTARHLQFLPLMKEMCAVESADGSLASLARRANLSESHFQRTFADFAGESPKRFLQRVRLDGAAAELLATDTPILGIALDAGFASHEVFTRAFARQFGCTPSEYRERSVALPERSLDYREVVRSVSPCLRLYGMSTSNFREDMNMPTSTVERRVLEHAQPILFIQRRVLAKQLQQTMGECFGALYMHGQKAGLAIAGHPMSRYVTTGAGLWTVDFILPLLRPAEPNGEMQAGTLASGPVAFAVHEGPYDLLSETYAAIERWIETSGYAVGGPPWESYVTDPGVTPNPADWRTEVFWPLAK